MNRAFSLVELSIVLVILGLLTGGILTGQNLIRAAELRAVTIEYQAYAAAVHTFRDKYLAIPGDIPTRRLFGAMATGTCPNATAGTGTQTCNGDGDGTITEAAAVSQTGEYFTFWQHLANAGLIEGNYTGIAGSATTGRDTVFNENAPLSRMGNTGWSIMTQTFPGDFYWLQRNAANGRSVVNGLVFGGQVTGYEGYGTSLKPEEMWNIDTKMDDGKPFYGKFQSINWNVCTTAAGNTSYDADYDLTVTSSPCSILMLDTF